MTDAVKIGLRIKQCREEKGWSQAELGAVLGLNKSTIQRYETGKVARIKLPVLESIAYELDVNPEYLALETDDPIDYENLLDDTGASLDVIEHFDGDAEKICKFMQAVDEDTQFEKALTSYLKINDSLLWRFVASFSKLNSIGKEQAVERIEELAEIKKYTENGET